MRHQMTRTLLILMMVGVMSGCMSRSQFRDRMDNMADVHSHDWMRLQRQINEQASQIEALEKKVEEPCLNSKVDRCFPPNIFSNGRCYSPERPNLGETHRQFNNETERPNYPCYLCDKEPRP